MVTEEGKILGTVAYMSPEQAQGKVVDARSDIFSLGILLYEMATGRRPFEGDSKISILSSVIKDTPVPAIEVNRALPRHLGRIIKHCLEKSPDRRYQSALDIRNELEALREEIRSGEVDLPTGEHVLSAPDALPGSQLSATSSGSLSGTALEPQEPSMTSGTSGVTPFATEAGSTDGRRGWVIPVVVVFAIAAAVLGWMALRPGESPTDAPVAEVSGDTRPSLAVLPFVNTGNSEELDWLTDGVAEMLVTDLSQAAGIRVVGGERVREILDEMGSDAESLVSLDVVRDVAASAGTAVVVTGSFVQAGEQLRVSVRIIDTNTGEVMGGENVDGAGMGSIFATVDTLSSWIRDSVDTSRATISAPIDRDLVDVTTDSVEAFRFYSEGVKRQDRGDFEQAIEFFEEAVRLDPGFALAYVKLSTTHGNLFRYQGRDEYAELALENADRLSERERYYLQGAYYGARAETNDRAIEGYEKALDLYPDDTASLNNLGLRLQSAHRHQESAAAYEEAIRRGTTFGGTRTNLVLAYLMLGRTEGCSAYRPHGPRRRRRFDARDLRRSRGVAGHGRDRVGPPCARRPRLRYRGRLDPDGEFPGCDPTRGLGVARASAREGRRTRVSPPGCVRCSPQPASCIRVECPRPSLSRRVQVARDPARCSILAPPPQHCTWSGATRNAGSRWLWRPASKQQIWGAEMSAVSVAARARAALGRSAAVDALVQDHAAMAGRGAGAHEERDHLLLRGQLALAAGQPREAIAALEEAATLLEAPLRCCTSHAAVWSVLGRAHLELGNLGEAEQWFHKVSELGDARSLFPLEFVRSFYFLGKARAEGGNDAGAREAYQRFLSYWEDGDIDRERVAEARGYVDGA